ncbi:MAG: helix-turn-helix domain-containing protein [Lachnospiraceae bacterium]|nr:helix-turn-helix domain-containing protein [Candidatus Colinaster equi]
MRNDNISVGRKPIISDDEIRNILSRNEKGENISALAAEYGVSRQALYKRMNNMKNVTVSTKESCHNDDRNDAVQEKYPCEGTSNGVKIAKGCSYPLGASVVDNGKVNYCVVIEQPDEPRLVITNPQKRTKKTINLSEYRVCGDVYAVTISGIDFENTEYFYINGKESFCDPFGSVIVGNEHFGRSPIKLRSKVSAVSCNNMSAYTPLGYEYSDSVIYTLHVRGFSMHASSDVDNPGTFSGIIQKIPYLKNLGITAVELLPAYEFLEMDKEKVQDDYIDAYSQLTPKLNYWGYKAGYYMAPKAAYCNKGDRPDRAFMELVDALHMAGLEIIMQFYFPRTVKQVYIPSILKHWVNFYHVDGFHLMGESLPLTILGTDPVLSKTKILYYGFPFDEIYGVSKPAYRNLAICNDDYMYSMRRFIKSDEGQIMSVINNLRANDDKCGIVHYITKTDGFTLMDMVSYDRKHNIQNGESNRDGNPYNASWNCGVEGATDRKKIANLRVKQIRNAILLNVLGQSTPMILAGDEMGKSQKGNNNPYCIDGPLTWLNWKDVDKNKDIYEFYRFCLKFRKDNKILHMSDKMHMTDYKASGYPDLSYHGEEAWKIETDDLTRHFAMMYSGEYAGADNFIYIAINMHWTMHEFALPQLPMGQKWYKCIDTGVGMYKEKELVESKKQITVDERSIVILMSSTPL